MKGWRPFRQLSPIPGITFDLRLLKCLAGMPRPLNFPRLHHVFRACLRIRSTRPWRSRCSSGAGVFLGLVLWFALAASVRADDVTQSQDTTAQEEHAYVSPTNGLGSWIWADKRFDGQACYFWRAFDVPTGDRIVRARLRMTVDNEFVLLLDGRELGRGSEWREIYDFDLTPLITPGRHTLGIKALNSSGFAGMLLGMRLELANGGIIEIKSDESWRVAPSEARGWATKKQAPDSWPPATIVGPLGGSPWWTVPLNVNVMPTLRPIQLYIWQTGWFQISLLSICGLVILFSFRLMAQVALQRKEQWLLHRERARIARDIHDDIGARMTQLVLHGEVAQNDLPPGSDMRLEMEGLCQEARQLLSTMDEILWAVNPQRDTLRDFSSYVCNYAQTFLKPTSIQCLFEVDPEMPTTTLALPLRRNLLMAIKETLNNAVKYSQATELRLKIQWDGRQLIVVVQDNGRGFDPANVKPDRCGLSNMAQRMKELGGSCRITSQPGQGCHVEFGIPLVQPSRYTFDWMWGAKRFRERG